MNIHEYQAKEVLRSFGVPVPQGFAATTIEEAAEAAGKLPGPVYVVKAQIHAGGRGKGKFKELPANAKGGVRLAKSFVDIRADAVEMLGNTLVTVQTGPAGKQVNRIYVEEGSEIDKEFYLSLLIDRATSRVSFVVSTEGGMDIEQVAHDTPEKIVTFSVDPATGIMPHHGRAVARALGLDGDLAKQAQSLVESLYAAFTANDMEMLEINPLIVSKDGKLRCLDAKVGFDSNALARHPDIAALRDETEEDPKEIEASKYDLSYVALDGTIGCMVNGAGLAMATMDIIKFYGAEPANFLDVGGGATRREGDGGLQDHHRRSQRQRHSRQHLRRHHALRRDRGRRGGGGEGSGPQGSAGGAARRHQRRTRQADPQAERAQRHSRRRSR